MSTIGMTWNHFRQARRLRHIEADTTVAWLRRMKNMEDAPEVKRIGETLRRREAQLARRLRERGEL